MRAGKLLAAALEHARGGWAVVPYDAHGKRPLTPHGYLDASTDAAVIRGWWAKWPQAGIGLAMRPSGCLCIDVDVDPAQQEQGDKTLAALERELGPTPT